LPSPSDEVFFESDKLKHPGQNTDPS